MPRSKCHVPRTGITVIGRILLTHKITLVKHILNRKDFPVHRVGMILSEVNNLERNISQLKRDLSNLSEERWRAALARSEENVFKARVKAVEKTLANCNIIAKYVSHFSAPMGNEIQRRELSARKTFERIRTARDSKILDSWIKEQLIPSAKLAELMAHMTASATKRVQGSSSDFHKWQVR
ncbi:MAG: hypothetical protein ACYCPW_04105 [Nitrososphaerales archaeon]